MSGEAWVGQLAWKARARHKIGMSDTPQPDRVRSANARKEILHAFTRMVLEQPYGRIRIVDLVEAAAVGRSTFYEHFGSKDEILMEVIEPILLALTTAASGRAAPSYIHGAVAHLWATRAIGRRLLRSNVTPMVQRRLAQRILPHVERIAPQDGAPLLTATGIAAAQIAMLSTWLAGEASCPAEAMADKLIASARLTQA